MMSQTIPALLIAILALTACGPAGDAPAAEGTVSEGRVAEGAAVEDSAASASRAASSARVEVEGDAAVGPATVVVYLLEDGEGVSGAEVEVTGDMTHAGMAPVIAETVEAEPGLYRTEGFEFTMGGDWILTAEIAMPDGSTATAQSALTVPAR